MTPAERITAAAAWYGRHRAELPSAPFQLSQGVRVSEPTRFYAALDEAISGWQTKRETSRLDVCHILLPMRKLRAYLEKGGAT
ncbi:MAG: hypothetical protein F6K00_19790 [Leptolyngbya sp. SIOISBB]|nr:hypothetical protein [Leptolyngbya sp. SIOISBB]